MSSTRLGSLLRWDLLLQYRYHFYHVAAVMTALWIVIFTQLTFTFLVAILPFFLLTNLTVGTFIFVGGLVLFEKDEHTIDALVLSPLQFNEYLGSKVITLALLGLLENGLLIFIVSYRLDLYLPPILIAIVLMAIIYVLFGFGFAVRYSSLNDYIIPAVVVMMVLQLPVLQFFGFTSLYWQIVYYLTPLQPALLLVSAGFGSLSPVKWTVGIAGSIFWILVGSLYAKKQYHKHIIRRIGL